MVLFFFFFYFNDTATTEIYTLSLHDALPISKQTTQADEQIGAGNRAFDKQKSALEYKFNEQRQSATDRYNFEVNRANAIIQQTSAQWTNYVSSMRRKFKQGIQTNNSGIADLLKSGALVLT